MLLSLKMFYATIDEYNFIFQLTFPLLRVKSILLLAQITLQKRERERERERGVGWRVNMVKCYSKNLEID